jgi:hypothetical protein
MVVVSWSTPDVRSHTIAPREHHTTSDAKLGFMIERSRRRGLRVLLFPLLDVRKRKPLEWRGTIRPSDWDLWWKQYERFILHYAKLAARHGASIFCIGSELVSTEEMRQRWVALARRVRAHYRGKLLYSANWDHYEPVSFWDAVDLVGLTAYYRLSSSRSATEAQMRATWNGIRAKLVRWSQRVGRRLVFTEVGYPSLDGGAVDPWDYTQRTRLDLEEQRRAYAAFVGAWSNTPELAGVFFWDWYGAGGRQDTHYTPRKKPAEAVLRRWFLGRSPPDTEVKRRSGRSSGGRPTASRSFGTGD